MRIVVDVLLNLEHLVLGLQVHADRYVQRLVLIGQRVVVSILHVTACKLVPLVNVHVVLDEVSIEVFNDKIPTLQINNRTLSTLLVNQYDRTDTCFLGYEGIVGTEVRSDMYNTGTVVGRYIVTGNHLEGIAHRLDSGHQLFVLHTNQVSTFVAGHDTIGNQLVTTLILGQFAAIGNGTLSGQIGIQTGLSQDNRDRFSGIRIIGLNGYVVNLRTYAEG